MLSPNCCQMLSVQEVAAGRLRQSFRVVQASFVEPRHVLQTPLKIFKIALNLLSLGYGSEVDRIRIFKKRSGFLMFVIPDCVSDIIKHRQCRVLKTFLIC